MLDSPFITEHMHANEWRRKVGEEALLVTSDYNVRSTLFGKFQSEYTWDAWGEIVLVAVPRPCLSPLDWRWQYDGSWGTM